MWWYVYLLACADGKFYVGCTSNLTDRIQRHRNGQVPATCRKRPVRLIAAISLPDKYLAFAFEKYLKSMGWPSQRIDIEVDVPAAAVLLEPGEGEIRHVRLKGIFFTPLNCETICLACTPSGRLSSIATWRCTTRAATGSRWIRGFS